MFEEKKLPLSEKLEISDNKNFGWKVKEEIEEGSGKKKIKYVVLTRDKNLRNYITLSNLEKIFPPAFFDIMVHLTIHLAREAQIAGPVQFRWMYPFER